MVLSEIATNPCWNPASAGLAGIARDRILPGVLCAGAACALTAATVPNTVSTAAKPLMAYRRHPRAGMAFRNIRATSAMLCFDPSDITTPFQIGRRYGFLRSGKACAATSRMPVSIHAHISRIAKLSNPFSWHPEWPAYRRWSAHRLGERPDVTDKELGLLQGGEVAALVEFGPVAERRKDHLRPRPDRPRSVLREERHSGRHRQRPGSAPGPEEVGVEVLGFEVQLGAGPGGPREPVDRGVGQQVATAHRVLGPVLGVRPLLELLHDPGELAGRRVGQPVGECLRAGGLDLQPAHAVLLEVHGELRPL